jgi:hypothetical protein
VCYFQHPEMVKMLLQRGADIHKAVQKAAELQAVVHTNFDRESSDAEEDLADTTMRHDENVASAAIQKILDDFVHNHKAVVVSALQKVLEHCFQRDTNVRPRRDVGGFAEDAALIVCKYIQKQDLI